jgi:hypothetical protein
MPQSEFLTLMRLKKEILEAKQQTAILRRNGFYDSRFKNELSKKEK